MEHRRILLLSCLQDTLESVEVVLDQVLVHEGSGSVEDVVERLEINVGRIRVELLLLSFVLDGKSKVAEGQREVLVEEQPVVVVSIELDASPETQSSDIVDHVLLKELVVVAESLDAVHAVVKYVRPSLLPHKVDLAFVYDVRSAFAVESHEVRISNAVAADLVVLLHIPQEDS